MATACGGIEPVQSESQRLIAMAIYRENTYTPHKIFDHSSTQVVPRSRGFTMLVVRAPVPCERQVVDNAKSFSVVGKDPNSGLSSHEVTKSVAASISELAPFNVCAAPGEKKKNCGHAAAV